MEGWVVAEEELGVVAAREVCLSLLHLGLQQVGLQQVGLQQGQHP